MSKGRAVGIVAVGCVLVAVWWTWRGSSPAEEVARPALVTAERTAQRAPERAQTKGEVAERLRPTNGTTAEPSRETQTPPAHIHIKRAGEPTPIEDDLARNDENDPIVDERLAELPPDRQIIALRARRARFRDQHALLGRVVTRAEAALETEQDAVMRQEVEERVRRMRVRQRRLVEAMERDADQALTLGVRLSDDSG